MRLKIITFCLTFLFSLNASGIIVSFEQCAKQDCCCSSIQKPAQPNQIVLKSPKSCCCTGDQEISCRVSKDQVPAPQVFVSSTGNTERKFSKAALLSFNITSDVSNGVTHTVPTALLPLQNNKLPLYLQNSSFIC
jgi:hypothetical protein